MQEILGIRRNTYIQEKDKRQVEDGLPLYMESNGQMKQVDATRAHYVTITGLVSHERKGYYRISS